VLFLRPSSKEGVEKEMAMRKVVLLLAAMAAAVLMIAVPAWGAQWVSFASAQNFPTGGGPRTVTSADFNADGNTDLATGNIGSDDVSVLLGNSDGTFQQAQEFGVGDAPLSVTSADLNADGNTDLATTNTGSDDVSVLLGNGDGTFQQARSFGAGDAPRSLISADFNADGNTDLANVNLVSNDVSVLLGNGDGTFQTAQRFRAMLRPESVTSADFNADGNTDLAVVSPSSRETWVFLGQGDGTFQTARIVTALNVLGARSVTTADLNADGNTDLVGAAMSTGSVYRWLGNGDGTFRAYRTFPTGGSDDAPLSVTSADLNADGNTDLVSANNNSDDVSVLLGNGDGTLQTARKFDVLLGEDPARPQTVTSADFNGDGMPDLATANNLANNVSVLMNTPDTTRPSTTAMPSSTANTAGWYKEDVTVTLKATDEDGSGVKEITYSINGGQPITTQGDLVQVPVTDEGENTIAYYATDNAGNIEQEQNITVKLDKTAPAVSSTDPSNNKTGVPSSTTVSAKFAEVGSGLDRNSVVANDTFKLERLKPTGKVEVSGAVTCESSSSCLNPTFSPSAPLPKGAFQATITTGVKDNAGNQLATDYTWQFITVGPSKK
jgi:hypothetical protein